MSSRLPMLLRLIVTLLGFTSTNAWADYTLNMTRGASPISSDIHQLHMTILWVCVVIGILVYSLMIWAIIRHRKAAGHKAAAFHESTAVEIIWTIIPFIILIVMAVPATRTLIHMSDVSNAEVTIKVTGHRWFWQYDYLDEDISFFSYLSTPEDEIKNLAPKNPHYLLEVDKPMVVPVGKKIRLLVTGKDVIHSWWVPALGVKKDAIPGFINEVWTLIDADKPGIYRGQCAELCGTKHGYMPIVVEAKSEQDYNAWVAEQKKAKSAAANDENKQWTLNELVAQGEQEYNKVCAMCHQANGQGNPPTFPSLVTSAIVTKPEHKVEQLRQILFGKNAMPPLGQNLTDLQIAAIATYERNAWGHNTGDIIQPSDVKAVREQGKPK
ncbi:MAG: cytochrome c oxidase subunit II [Gammaproteobacteria bacterium]|nr:cytochrome c oxidase subunit II [Gammaproteobacteria bacterium]